ncbi:MAG: S-layer homology domain-containing protein [Clostridia bacterium]|nr:S-layer homology domain-containing protein [Clostridia bacterium]
MNKRILSTVMAVLMLLSVFSVCAYAAPNTEITYIGIKNVVAPSVGAKPAYTYTNNGTTYHFCDEYEGDNDGAVKNCMEWYDITAQKSVKPNETFQAGHAYSASFYLIADDGYIFPEIVDEIYINGETAQGIFLYNEIGHSFRYYVSLSFFPLDYPIESIAITGVTAPTAGAKPAYKATVASNEPYTVTSAYDSGNIKNGIVWYDTTANKEVKSTDTFIAGHAYSAGVYLRAKPDYAFSRVFLGSITLNGKEAQGAPADVMTMDEYVQDYMVVYEFPSGSTATKIASVTVTGITEPVAGKSPLYNANVNANANYEAYQKNMMTAISWFDVTANKAINSVSVFEAGHTYRLTIKLQAKANCEFKLNASNAPQVTGKINNYTAAVAKSGSLDPRQVVEVSYEFKLDGEPDISFPDVKQSSWYYDAVQYVAKKGFVTGYQDGRFGPNDNLKRQDFVVILARIAKANTEAYTACPLKDVKMNAYYGPSVAWAVTNNIIAGYQNGNFGVNDNITREQVATILYRYMGAIKVENVEETLSKFSDAKRISPFAKDAVAWAVQNNIISGMADGRVAPTEGASRAQIATIIMNMDKAGMFP